MFWRWKIVQIAWHVARQLYLNFRPVVKLYLEAKEDGVLDVNEKEALADAIANGISKTVFEYLKD